VLGLEVNLELLCRPEWSDSRINSLPRDWFLIVAEIGRSAHTPGLPVLPADLLIQARNCQAPGRAFAMLIYAKD